nr:hypothetical protein CFP56_46790 [Quercus suber]
MTQLRDSHPPKASVQKREPWIAKAIEKPTNEWENDPIGVYRLSTLVGRRGTVKELSTFWRAIIHSVALALDPDYNALAWTIHRPAP